MSRLYALVYHFGMPSIYFPFSPDDTFTTMNIRLSYPQLDNEDFPAKEKGLAETLKGGKSEFKSMKITNKALRTLLASGNGAVAAAEVFSQIVEAVFSDLIGMPSTSEAKKTITRPLTRSFRYSHSGIRNDRKPRQRILTHAHSTYTKFCLLFGIHFQLI